MGIRPGFASMYSKFENREYFEYGIPEFDKLIQTKECPSSFIIFQEQVMKTFIYAGFPEDETYGIIKAVAKKNPEVINALKSEFKDKLVAKGLKTENIEKIWTIIENNANYSFNSSHSYCVALDSLYGAYLKAHFPYEFYCVMCEFYSEKKNNDKVSDIINEMKNHFNIHMGNLEFHVDNRSYTADKNKQTIYPSLLGVKYINKEATEILYEMGKKEYRDFYSIYSELLNHKKVLNKRSLETLLKIRYFDKYGENKKLLNFVSLKNTLFKNKTYNKIKSSKEVLSLVSRYAEKEGDKTYSQINDELFHYLLKILPNEKFSLGAQLKNEIEFAGTPITDIPNNISVGQVVARSYKKNVFLFKSWKNNAELWINTHDAKSMPDKGDIVLIYNVEVKQRRFGKKTRNDYYAEIETMKKGKKK